MSNAKSLPWPKKHTDQTREIERVLRAAGFAKVDAYRYNPASIRVRVVDAKFEGRSLAARDKMVEPHLAKLDERTQADIVNLFTFAPSELQDSARTLRQFLLNTEFDHPSPSIL